MEISPNTTCIGFIGTGVMGAAMAGHLLDAGYRLVVYNRSRSRAEGLLTRGAVWANTPAAVAQEADVIVTMVGYPQDVESIYLGADGLVAHAKPGALLIDMTTSSPRLAMRIYEAAKARGVRALDAPVSGGDVGARQATLTIMVGGDEADFLLAQPVFSRLGKNIVHQGPAGAGQYTKMCNQIALASTMVGVCEAMAYAIRAGLEPKKVLASIGTGAAASWPLQNLVPRMLASDFAPGFYVKHFLKDMAIAIASAEEMGLRLPGVQLAKSLYERLAAAYGDDMGTQALWLVYRDAETKADTTRPAAEQGGREGS
ncbi:oxidoreductase [Alicyclobacillus cellulosilyticus]|uniref:Oxidoreductase n=1 Tax=Alicyclobacillus cellulosilyticus TaxID=1003997 RepID=A0A917KG34_9BACL|nr:NAD(P)-dependent oxidoreductase [Alicyclobacillus cellulosilyticus]GGJ12924.1 oxidoreductase [Alicyclobacillus cellulosilyticus]